jgi:UMF1 family MFS transporter
MAPEVQVAAETPESVGFSRITVLTKPVLSWALYDLANTIFSMNIVSLYLSLWVVNVMGPTPGQTS